MQIENFEIEIQDTRVYGDINRRTFQYVRIINTRTDQIFHDWVRPDQIQSANSIRSLIRWREPIYERA